MITTLALMLFVVCCALEVDFIVTVEIFTQSLITDSAFQGIPKMFGFSSIIRRQSSISKKALFFQPALPLLTGRNLIYN